MQSQNADDDSGDAGQEGRRLGQHQIDRSAIWLGDSTDPGRAVYLFRGHPDIRWTGYDVGTDLLCGLRPGNCCASRLAAVEGRLRETGELLEVLC